MRKGLLLRVLMVCLFAVVLVFSFLTLQPVSSGTAGKTSPEQSLVDYCVLFCMWGVMFVVVYLLGRQAGHVGLIQLLDAAATGLSSLLLSTFMLGVYPEISGNPSAAYSQEIIYTIPLLLTAITTLYWLSNKLKHHKKQQTEEAKV